MSHFSTNGCKLFFEHTKFHYFNMYRVDLDILLAAQNKTGVLICKNNGRLHTYMNKLTKYKQVLGHEYHQAISLLFDKIRDYYKEYNRDLVFTISLRKQKISDWHELLDSDSTDIITPKQLWCEIYDPKVISSAIDESHHPFDKLIASNPILSASNDSVYYEYAIIKK